MKLDHEQTALLIKASLARSYFKSASSHFVMKLLRHYAQALYKGVQLPLPGVLLDLWGLLFDDLKFNRGRMSIASDSLYRDLFLHGFSRSTEYQRLREISTIYNEEDRVLFFFRFVSLFFTRLKVIDSIELSEVHLRGVLDDFTKLELLEEVELAGSLVKEEEGWWESLELTPVYENYSAQKSVLQEEDFWDLSMLKLIGNDSLRYAIKQCHRSRSHWMKDSEGLFSKIKKEVARLLSERAKETGKYPVGGIHELSTSGGLENLLRSELIYMEVNDPVDLFGLKYLERELLYYQRDNNEQEVITLDFKIFMASTGSYPNGKSTGVHPFFLYGLLSCIIDISQQIHPRYRFHFELVLQVQSERDREFESVLQSFLAPAIGMKRLRLSSQTEAFDIADKSNPRDLYLGMEDTRCHSLNWSRQQLKFTTPEQETIFENPQQLHQWIQAIFLHLFLQAALSHSQ